MDSTNNADNNPAIEDNATGLIRLAIDHLKPLPTLPK